MGDGWEMGWRPPLIHTARDTTSCPSIPARLSVPDHLSLTMYQSFIQTREPADCDHPHSNMYCIPSRQMYAHPRHTHPITPA